jgi:hypothetical protein
MMGSNCGNVTKRIQARYDLIGDVGDRNRQQFVAGWWPVCE